MNYLWQSVLSSQQLDIPAHKLKYRPVAGADPYTETSFQNVNQTNLMNNAIDINPFFRFGDVYESLLDESIIEENAEFREVLFDIVTHVLAWIDMQAGLYRHEYYGIFLRDDLKNCVFGNRHRGALKFFQHDQVRHIVDAMVHLYHNGPSLSLLRTLLRKLYMQSMLYLDMREQNELLIYIGKKKTKQLERQVDFVISFFVPLDYEIHLFWDKHFGIIGIDETMQIGDFMIY